MLRLSTNHQSSYYDHLRTTQNGFRIPRLTARSSRVMSTEREKAPRENSGSKAALLLTTAHQPPTKVGTCKDTMQRA